MKDYLFARFEKLRIGVVIEEDDICLKSKFDNGDNGRVNE